MAPIEPRKPQPTTNTKPTTARHPTSNGRTILPETLVRDTAKKITLTKDEDRRAREVMDVLADTMGSKVNYALVTRALWAVLSETEDSIRASGSRAPSMRHPSKGDVEGMAAYEDAIAAFLGRVIKRSGRD